MEKRGIIEKKARMLEERAKQNEHWVNAKGGIDRHIEMGENVADMFLEAIKAKLTILENI